MPERGDRVRTGFFELLKRLLRWFENGFVEAEVELNVVPGIFVDGCLSRVDGAGLENLEYSEDDRVPVELIGFLGVVLYVGFPDRVRFLVVLPLRLLRVAGFWVIPGFSSDREEVAGVFTVAGRFTVETGAL